MTWVGLKRLLQSGMLLSVAGAAFAEALSVEHLQRLLQDAPHADVRFTEMRESRWLAAPIESSGTMRSNAMMLEKRVERPRPETWRILSDRMQVTAPGSDGVKEVMLDRAPAAAALADALRRVMAGDLEALNKDFQLELSGDEREWTLQLTPRHPDVARQLKQISLQGAGRRLAVIVIQESQGDRTTTRLHYPD
jgi:Outer membrane lipoprotein carrier protein LolA-like